MKKTQDKTFKIAIKRSNKKIKKLVKQLPHDSLLYSTISDNLNDFKDKDYLTDNNKIEYAYLENKSYQSLITTISFLFVIFFVALAFIDSAILRTLIHISIFHRLFIIITFISYSEYYLSVDRIMNLSNKRFEHMLPISSLNDENEIDNHEGKIDKINAVIKEHTEYLFLLKEINELYNDIDKRYEMVTIAIK